MKDKVEVSARLKKYFEELLNVKGNWKVQVNLLMLGALEIRGVNVRKRLGVQL